MIVCNQDVLFRSYVTCTHSYGAGNMGQEKNMTTGKQVLPLTTQILKLLMPSCTQLNKTDELNKKTKV